MLYSIKKPTYKNLKFKNRLGKNSYFKSPFHKNLFSLRFSVGSYYTKMKAEMKIHAEKRKLSLGFTR